MLGISGKKICYYTKLPTTMLKNKVMYRQFIHSVQCSSCKIKILYMFKTFVTLLSGHASYLTFRHRSFTFKF
jgi:hypothetical protein